MSDRRLAIAMHIDRAMDVQPVAGWPDAYAAWLPDLVQEIRTMRASRKD